MSIGIQPFSGLSNRQRKAAAEILVAALAHMPSAWRDLPSAGAEVTTFFDAADRLALAAIAADQLLGWVGAIRQSRHAWELHPLAVAPAHQRRGIGTLLVKSLEAEARAAGIGSIWLGTDDDFGGTNLHGIDLYPDVLQRLSGLAPTTGHPFTFYRRLGYTVVGVLPDATGFGRPDILMAKRIASGGS